MYVITGGGTGIGASLALALAERGEQCLIIARRENNLKKIAAQSPLIHYLIADISLPGSELAIQAEVKNNTIKGLIHNAGTIMPIAPIADVSLDEWEKLIKLNLFTPLRLTKAFIKNLSGNKVLHIGSAAAHFPIAGWSGYCVSKAGLAMLTKCMQVEFTDISVASVMPGIVETDMTALIRQSSGMNAENLAFHTTLYNEGRLLKTQTVAQFLAWLLLDIEKEQYSSQEWDIYEKNHHENWLKAPHVVPEI